MVMSKYRQKTFIDPAVQGMLVRRVIGHWVVFMVTAMGAITLLQMVLGDPEKTIVEHFQTASKDYALFFIVLISLLPAFILDTVRLSHRFAGPVYRLRQTIQSVTNGEPFTPMRFRRKDYWSVVADEFNEMMDKLGVTQSPVPALEETDSQADSDNTSSSRVAQASNPEMAECEETENETTNEPQALA